ncbi:MAG: hypothetical protein KGJ55_03015 [Gammaproteobacteria bacterium]|nr:hypothetical protein [Gammaproteobacteria bacterium]
MRLHLLPIIAAAAAAAAPGDAPRSATMDSLIHTVMGVTVRRYYGYAYDTGSGRHLYTEVHAQRYDTDGHWLGGTVDYYAAAGQELAHKTLDFSKSPYVPRYRLDDVKPKYDEGISKITADKIYLFKQTEKDETPQRQTVDRNKNMAADAGLESYLRSHMAELMAGKTLELTLVVAGKLDSYSVRARRMADTRFDGKPEVRFKIELSNVLRWFIKPIVVIYDPQARRLLEYIGVSNVLDPETGKVFKSVRIVYSDRPLADAPRDLPPLQ